MGFLDDVRGNASAVDAESANQDYAQLLGEGETAVVVVGGSTSGVTVVWWSFHYIRSVVAWAARDCVGDQDARRGSVRGWTGALEGVRRLLPVRGCQAASA